MPLTSAHFSLASAPGEIASLQSKFWILESGSDEQFKRNLLADPTLDNRAILLQHGYHPNILTGPGIPTKAEVVVTLPIQEVMLQRNVISTTTQRTFIVALASLCSVAPIPIP